MFVLGQGCGGQPHRDNRISTRSGSSSQLRWQVSSDTLALGSDQRAHRRYSGIAVGQPFWNQISTFILNSLSKNRWSSNRGKAELVVYSSSNDSCQSVCRCCTIFHLIPPLGLDMSTVSWFCRVLLSRLRSAILLLVHWKIYLRKNAHSTENKVTMHGKGEGKEGMSVLRRVTPSLQPRPFMSLETLPNCGNVVHLFSLS